MKINIIKLLILLILVTNVTCYERFNITINDTIINKNSFFDASETSDWGKLISVLDDTEEMEVFELYLNTTERHGYSDGEAIDVVNNFFWGMRSGIALELGALDGQYLSQSKPMVDKLGWKRILIEGAPTWIERLTEYSTDALALSLAVCNHPHFIHYIDKKDEGINGILEYMSPQFMRDFHKDAIGVKRDQWHTIPGVTKVPCFPLSSVFSEFHIHYINYFILDVEGAEYDVLQSINFENVMFDVITVETEKQYRVPFNTVKITALLRSKGYDRVWCSGRNSWYVHHTFKISTNPNNGFVQGCIRDP